MKVVYNRSLFCYFVGLVHCSDQSIFDMISTLRTASQFFFWQYFKGILCQNWSIIQTALPGFLNASKYCGSVLKNDFVIVVVVVLVVADKLLSNFQGILSFRISIHYLMGIGPNTKKIPRIAESRFGYLRVCSLIVYCQ